jgi:hypothetical protein
MNPANHVRHDFGVTVCVASVAVHAYVEHVGVPGSEDNDGERTGTSGNCHHPGKATA